MSSTRLVDICSDDVQMKNWSTHAWANCTPVKQDVTFLVQ